MSLGTFVLGPGATLKLTNRSSMTPGSADVAFDAAAFLPEGYPPQCESDVSLPSGAVAHVLGGGCFQQLGSENTVTDDVAVNGLVFHRLDSSASISVDSAAQTLTSSGALQLEAVASGSSGVLSGSAIPLETLAAPAKFDIGGAAANGLQFPSLSSAALFGMPLSFGVYGQFGDQNTHGFLERREPEPVRPVDRRGGGSHDRQHAADAGDESSLRRRRRRQRACRRGTRVGVSGKRWANPASNIACIRSTTAQKAPPAWLQMRPGHSGLLLQGACGFLATR